MDPMGTGLTNFRAIFRGIFFSLKKELHVKSEGTQRNLAGLHR